MIYALTAFLNAGVEEDVFARMLPVYEVAGKSGMPPVMKLKERLYGLRRNPENWCGTMDYYLSPKSGSASQIQPMHLHIRG